jgi:hypothetical protein
MEESENEESEDTNSETEGTEEEKESSDSETHYHRIVRIMNHQTMKQKRKRA